MIPSSKKPLRPENQWPRALCYRREGVPCPRSPFGPQTTAPGERAVAAQAAGTDPEPPPLTCTRALGARPCPRQGPSPRMGTDPRDPVGDTSPQTVFVSSVLVENEPTRGTRDEVPGPPSSLPSGSRRPTHPAQAAPSPGEAPSQGQCGLGPGAREGPWQVTKGRQPPSCLGAHLEGWTPGAAPLNRTRSNPRINPSLCLLQVVSLTETV